MMNKEEYEKLQARLLMQAIRARSVVKAVEKLHYMDELLQHLQVAANATEAALQLVDNRLWNIDHA